MSARERSPWSSNMLPELLRLAWPIGVSMLSYSTMAVVDTAFVGRLGSAALAGVGLAGVVSFALVVFGIGLLRAVKILVSQAVGAGREDEIDDVVAAGLLWALALGAAAAALGQVLALALPGLAASAAAGIHATVYLQVRIIGAPAMLLYAAIREARYGVGDSRSPMVAAIGGNLLNIALDYLLIVVLDCGVAGAAWATVAANTCEAVVLVWLTRGVGLSRLRAGAARLAAIARVGVSTGLQFTVEVGAFTVLSAIVAAISETEMAAHQIALHALHFGFLPAVAIAEAGSVLAGQAVGAERDDRVVPVALAALKLSLIYSLIVSLVLVTLGPAIAGLFTGDAGVRDAASGLLYLASGFLLADGAYTVARGILRGTGDVRTPAVVAMSASWLCLPPLAWGLGDQLGLGALGAWLGLTLEILIAGTILWARLWRGGWLPSASRSRIELASRR